MDLIQPIFMKLIILKFLLGTLSVIIYFYFYHPITQESNIQFPTDSASTLKLTFVGDIMCHLPQIESARIGQDSFDFKQVFEFVINYLKSADLTLGNLETVIGEEKDNYEGYPLFKSPPEFLKALQYAGFDILFTSNNHSFDQGLNGVNNTIRLINEYGMKNLGTFLSKNDFDSLRIIEVNNVKIGLLAYTYGLNVKFKKEYQFSIKFIDTVLIRSEIERIKKNGAEVVIVYFHFGNEYSKKPSKYQKEIVKKIILYGADLIIGSHPHVVQPMGLVDVNNKQNRKVLVAYSLGNFISNQRWRYSDSGMILEVFIQKNKTNKVSFITEISFIFFHAILMYTLTIIFLMRKI